MFKHKHGHGPRMFLGILVMFALFSLAVMLLWNAVLPELTGAARVSYLQAAGLLALCRILCGGMNPFFSLNPMREHFRSLSPEQREAFARRMHERFSGRMHRDFSRHDPKEPRYSRPGEENEDPLRHNE